MGPLGGGPRGGRAGQGQIPDFISRQGFSSSAPTDIWGRIILCFRGGGGCLCATACSPAALTSPHPMPASLPCQPRRPELCPSVPWGARPPAENRWVIGGGERAEGHGPEVAPQQGLLEGQTAEAPQAGATGPFLGERGSERPSRPPS